MADGRISPGNLSVRSQRPRDKEHCQCCEFTGTQLEGAPSGKTSQYRLESNTTVDSDFAESRAQAKEVEGRRSDKRKRIE